MKKTIFFSFAFAAGILLFSCSGNSSQKSSGDSAASSSNSNQPAAGSASSSSNSGQALYKANCVSCHGDDGTAGVMNAADLSKSQLPQAGVVSIVKNGKNMMPAFNGKLSDDQIFSVVAYAESLRK